MGARGWTLAGALLIATPAAATPKIQPPPAPPAIAVGARTFVAFAGQPAPVKLAWPPAPDVARYRARWTDAGALVDVELPGSATAFERAVATPGRHQLSVIAIDAAGRESPPTEIAVDIVTVTAIAPGADQPAFPSGPSSPAFAIGARFSSPGLACQLGRGDRAAEVTATAPGATTLRCGGEAGEPRIEVPIVIAPVIVDGTRTLVRDRTTTVHVTLGSVAAIGDRLDVEAIGDLELGDAERTAHGLDVPVTVRPGSTAAGLLIRAGAVELGKIELELVDAPAPPPAPASPTTWFALDLGAYAGVLVPPDLGNDGTWLGRPSNPAHAISAGPVFGGRVGLFPTRSVGLELEAALATPGYEGQAGVAAVLVTRGQLAARVVDDDRYGLRLLAGVDVLGVLTERGTSHRDAAGAVHYGAAFTVEVRRDLSLRLEALHLVTTARDAGYAHCVEVQLGLVTRVGRRDRGW